MSKIKKICIITILTLILLIFYYCFNNTNENFLVYIESENEYEIKSGTGIVYKYDDGFYYIITNYHIIDFSNKIKIYNSKNKSAEGFLVTFDDYKDVALIKVKLSDLSIARFDNCNNNLNDVKIIGFDNKKLYQKDGKLVNKLVDVDIPNDYGNSYYRAKEIYSNIEFGNSGSAVISNNRVIGILSAMNKDSGIGYVMPICDVTNIVSLLENNKIKRPSIGATLSNSNDNMGILITNISDYLKKYGITENDIIVGLNSVKTINVSEFRNELFKHNVGDNVVLNIIRDKEMINIEVVLI